MNQIVLEKNNKFYEIVEKMIRISKEKPLLPEEYIPWKDIATADTIFLPSKLVSLEGHELWNSLSYEQQVELGKLEVVQVMYSYAWSETLACHFFNRRLLELDPSCQEYKFLIRESIEEYRHQEMFGMAIEKLNREPILPSGLHRLFANLTVRYMPNSCVFLSVLTVEMMADIYAKHMRQDPKVFSVLRKSAELHHIEEGRHIFYTKHLIEKYTNGIGFLKASWYSIYTMINVYFMRSLYVQKDFFYQINVPDAKKYYRSAKKNYGPKFAEHTLGETIEFVESFNGMNWLTKPLWNFFLNTKL